MPYIIFTPTEFCTVILRVCVSHNRSPGIPDLMFNSQRNVIIDNKERAILADLNLSIHDAEYPKFNMSPMEQPVTSASTPECRRGVGLHKTTELDIYAYGFLICEVGVSCIAVSSTVSQFPGCSSS